MSAPIPAWIPAALLALVSVASAAATLPQTGIAYEIEVRLDPETRMLEGREIVRWTHPGTQPVRRVPMHLYLNAFSHERTTWMHGVPARRLRADEFLERWPDPWGWIEPTSIRQGESELPGGRSPPTTAITWTAA